MHAVAVVAVLPLLLLAGCTSKEWPEEPCPDEFAAQGCASRITEASALAIAREAGLGDGIAPWRTEFSAHADRGFRWGVSNTTWDESGPRSVERGGSLVAIDAATGKVVQVSGWSARS